MREADSVEAGEKQSCSKLYHASAYPSHVAWRNEGEHKAKRYKTN
jgi:hypothetical protein